MMTKTDWVMLVAVAIPVIPPLLKEVRLWWETWRKHRRSERQRITRPPG
ncbi:hypothetical protein J2T08_002989 [Neorhizobium galegae]|nr:hypothetical protein [Neorhizobium galegae]MDQ0135068.1 hypothetical protein [Neorhizobium galegae]